MSSSPLRQTPSRDAALDARATRDAALDVEIFRRVAIPLTGRSDDRTASEALAEFQRFPQWMWRNTVMLDFVDWLRAYDEALPANDPRVGFCGMDLYSLQSSMDVVIRYLDRIDPEAAQRARVRYACFDAAEKDPQAYTYAAAYGDTEPCEEMAVAHLRRSSTPWTCPASCCACARQITAAMQPRCSTWSASNGRLA